MKFSVIMASLLADYPNSATKKDAKFIRAIASVLNQEFQDFELIIVSDGCMQTSFLVRKFFKDEMTSGKIRLAYVQRTQMWTNEARNKGISLAQGDYIIYLDSDDVWTWDHLGLFNSDIKNEPWYYSRDTVSGAGDRECVPGEYGKCGTSNICHKRSLNLKWEQTGYGHDFHFINQLLGISPGVEIRPAGYVVARHVSKDLIIWKELTFKKIRKK